MILKLSQGQAVPAKKKTCLGLALGACLAVNPPSIADDNSSLQTAIDVLIAAHNVALPTALAPIPIASDIAEAVVYGTNIGLKYVRAPFTAPSDRAVFPNSANNCTYSLSLPQTEADYSNLLGIWDTTPLPPNWGALGAPSVSHANTDVVVSATKAEPDGFGRRRRSQSVSLPAGNHGIKWQADTQVSVLFDYTLPIVAYGITNLIYGKAATKLADRSAGQALRQAKFQLAISETLFNIGVELGLIGADMASNTGTTTVSHSHTQTFTVFDVLDPLISTDQPVISFEASDFGGTLYSRKEAQLFNSINASDPCGREYSLFNDAPVLLPLGSTELTWTVRDRGPNPSFESNDATLTQTVVVADTQAPIMIPPPGKVIESSTALTDQEVMLGVPRVVDLADSQPSVNSNAPASFPVDSRTEVVWQTTDASNNSSSGTQWITIKTPGTNNAPTADNKTTGTLTSDPVDILLTGSDPDFLDGRFDPLAFNIEQRPQNGEFVAPLLPYFIEDYRTRPEGPFGEEFRLSNNRSNWIFDNYCQPNLTLPRDFVYEPKFMHVTDDGTQYIVDRYWFCNPSNAQTEPRVSRWSADGEYLGQTSTSDNTLEQFVLDRDGNIYFISLVGAGSSTDLFLQRCSVEFGVNSTDCDPSWKFNYGSAPGINPSSLVYARVDSSLGIAYVTDKRNVYAFDIRVASGNDSPFLGVLSEQQFLSFNCSAAGSSNAGFTIDIDSESNLYIADPCFDRVHKFEPSFLTNDGDFVAGDYVGWLGRCDGSSNNACDDSRQRSKGYSCTDTTCFVNQTSGEEQGQFNTPLHIALDPNDILYVADYANRRIQRFSPDGSFAGEAESTGTGINMGDEPSFILGNFDSPKTVTVNSSQFFIVDQAESFVHVFETSPLKDITDSSAVVTYVSDFSFHSATDSFTYTTSDGLATSNPATVNINVSRNFRPPEALPSSYSGFEDQDINLQLEGDDPDGVIGTGDFNALDVLTYRVIKQPANGTVLGSAQQFVYRPNPDFHGDDSFEFVANDGVFDSSPALVSINVEGVNDPPVILLPEFPTAGLGFSTSLVAGFTDDDLQTGQVTQHQVEVTWGDGSQSTNGNIDSGGLEVVSPIAEGAVGIVTGSHVYQTPGSKTLRICVVDSSTAQSCETRFISVVSQAALAMEISPSVEEVSVGEQVGYEVELVNLEPDAVGSGPTADGVFVSHEIPAGLSLLSVDTNVGSCSINGAQVSCDLGSLASGSAANMTLLAMNDGSNVSDIEAELRVVALTNTDSTKDSYLGYTLTTLLADSTDTDGDGIYDVYENRYGLNAFADDANQDPDGDGLSNLDEFLAATAANDPDSDDDGIADGWEVDNGLDPLSSADGNGDNDGDGFTNLQEYLADRDPRSDEKSGSRLVPILSVFENDRLFVPAVQVGAEFYDLELDLVSSDPILFELATAMIRPIKIQVPDGNVFNVNSNVLQLSVVDALGDLLQVQMQLTNDAPVQLQVLGASGAAVAP